MFDKCDDLREERKEDEIRTRLSFKEGFNGVILKEGQI